MKSAILRTLLVTLAVSLLAQTAGARRPRRPSFEWGLEASIAGNYNSNILGVSSRDREKFLSDPSAFPTPLKSVDDLENELQVHPSGRWRAPLNLMVGGDYRFKYVHRLRNSFTDYQTHNLAFLVRPRVSGYRWSARLRLLAIPSFYVRVYRDRDYNEWRPAKYANFDYQLSGRYRWWLSLWSEVGAGYGTYYYDRSFTEYDTEYRYLSLSSGYDLDSGWSLSAAYTRRLSDNVGKSQPGVFTTPPADPAQLGDSEYGDSDSNEDDWSAQVTSHLDRWTSVPVDVSLNYRLRRRVYTTTHSLEQDPFHRGRLDRRNQITLSANILIVSHLTLQPYLAYDERRTDSPSSAVSLVKNFVRREIGMTLEYRIK